MNDLITPERNHIFSLILLFVKIKKEQVIISAFYVYPIYCSFPLIPQCHKSQCPVQDGTVNKVKNGHLKGGAIIQGWFRWADAPMTRGVAGIGIIITLILSLVRLLWRKSLWVVFLSRLVYMLAILGFYLLASFDTVHDISWWANTGLMRMMLLAFILLWLGGIGLLGIFLNGSYLFTSMLRE